MTEQEMTATGFTQKELLIRVEGKLDTHIAQSGEAHAAFMQALAQMRESQVRHEADDHLTTVKALAAKDLREEGRRDVLKYIFGTSVLALITGVGGLVIAVFKLAGG